MTNNALFSSPPQQYPETIIRSVSNSDVEFPRDLSASPSAVKHKKGQRKRDSSTYANRHVPSFLIYNGEEETKTLQIINDGRVLTAENLRNENSALSLSIPILVLDAPASIGMKLPKGKRGKLQVRDIADLVGHHYPVSVIDVTLQEELDGWSMQDLVEYFEDEDRIRSLTTAASPAKDKPLQQNQRRFRRRAAADFSTKQPPKVLNQISMEFSRTPLRALVSSPRFVRDMDWIDNVWPAELREREQYPEVQFYCLTSTAGCYTDFHVDFGGTAVWYHVLNGRKNFILIPPTDENLAVYEDWLCRPNQAELFYPDLLPSTKGCIKVTLEACQTLVIPTGWIHAVYTPVDSIVFGGNFLHGLDMSVQLKIYCLETRTRVQDKFRFPHFCPLMYYAGVYYLQKMRQGSICRRELEGLPDQIKALEDWWTMHSNQPQLNSKGSTTHVTLANAAHHAAKRSKCTSVEGMLASLRSEHSRIVRNGIHPNPHVLQPIKISLKLSSSPQKKSPRKVNGSEESKAHTGVAEMDKFRISLPSSAIYGFPMKKRKATAQDDLHGNGDPSDGDWKPKSGYKNRNRLAQRTPTTVHHENSSYRESAAASSNSSRPVSNKAKSTARQRIKKRFR